MTREAIGYGGSGETIGDPSAVPAFVARRQGGDHLDVEPELLAQRPRHRCVPGDHPVQLLATRQHEVETDPQPVQRSAPGAEHPEHAEHVGGGEGLGVVLARLAGRCRRRTSTPARGRRCGSRRSPGAPSSRSPSGSARRARRAPRSAARSGTGAGRAPSAARSRGLSPATRPPPARRAGRARSRGPRPHRECTAHGRPRRPRRWGVHLTRPPACDPYLAGTAPNQRRSS